MSMTHNASGRAVAGASRSADRTQEIDAVDVLEGIGPNGAPVRGAAAANELVDEKPWLASPSSEDKSSWSSIPVDMTVETTAVVRAVAVIERRTYLRRVVAGALAGCIALLAIGVVRQLVAPSSSVARSADATVTLASSHSFDALSSALARSSAAAQTAAASATGTLRFDRASLARGIWIDGARISAKAATLPCGVHKVRIGARASVRTVDVPCGAELVVKR